MAALLALVSCSLIIKVAFFQRIEPVDSDDLVNVACGRVGSTILLVVNILLFDLKELLNIVTLDKSEEDVGHQEDMRAGTDYEVYNCPSRLDFKHIVKVVSVLEQGQHSDEGGLNIVELD